MTPAPVGPVGPVLPAGPVGPTVPTPVAIKQLIASRKSPPLTGFFPYGILARQDCGSAEYTISVAISPNEIVSIF